MLMIPVKDSNGLRLCAQNEESAAGVATDNQESRRHLISKFNHPSVKTKTASRSNTKQDIN